MTEEGEIIVEETSESLDEIDDSLLSNSDLNTDNKDHSEEFIKIRIFY